MSLSGNVDALATRIATEINAVRASMVRSYAETLSTSATSYVVTHNLGTRDVVAQIYAVATPYAQVWATVERTSINSVTLRFATAPTAGEYRVVIQGKPD